MKCVLGCAFTLCLVLFAMPGLAGDSPRALLDKACDYVASAPAIRRKDTIEQTDVVITGQRRMEQEPQTNVATIEIDMPKHLARYTAMFQGEKLIMLKQGGKTAMKLGAGPWKTPAGPFGNLAKNLGNLFVCEIETPETKKNAPDWELTGTELLGGDEVLVIETQGNTAVPLAQERMAMGIAKAFAANPTQQPTVKVLEYSSKHWIGKTDYRYLRTVQKSKTLLTINFPDGSQQLIESSLKTTSEYGYNKVIIEIPEDARKVLSSADIPLQGAEQSDKAGQSVTN